MDAIVGYVTFLKAWNQGFSNVKIRKYKAVTGKCNACAMLTEARNKHLNYHIRQKITNLHALHRNTYMSKKMNYYSKIYKSLAEPEYFLSMISDGFAQNHTQIPWLANIGTFPASLNPKLQGVLQHGETFVS